MTPSGELQEKYSAQIQIQKGPYLNTEYIGFYMDSKNPALQSAAIRKAINIGFDREKMITYLRNTIGFPALNGFIPKGLAGRNTNLLNEYNPELARKLVTEFTNETGQVPSIQLATDINYLDICEFLQREMQKIGVELTIDLMPTPTLRQAKSSGKLEAFRASWIADYPDAENYLSLFYGQNFSPLGPNYTHFKNIEYDRLYAKAMTISSIEERALVYQKMDQMIMEYYPIVPLYYDQAICFVQKEISGLEMNPLNLLQLKKVRKN